jgi:hypothetical protein
MINSIAIGLFMAGLAALTWVTFRERFANRRKASPVPVRIRNPRQRR